MTILDLPGVLRLLQREIDRSGGQTAWAKKAGIDRTHINKVLHGSREPGNRILEVLKLEKVYRQRG
jgi:DNA-binding phage protein